MSTMTTEKPPRPPRPVNAAPTGPIAANGPTAITAFRLPKHILRRLEQTASRKNVSRTQVVIGVLSDHLAPEEPSSFD